MRIPLLGPMALAVVVACSGSGGSSTDGGSGASSSGSMDNSGSAASSGFGGSMSESGPGSTSGSGDDSGGGGGGNDSGSAGVVTYGQPYAGGQYHLGPVDYSETQFHNACAPGNKYDQRVQQVEGTLLAGLWSGIPNVAGYCDACVWMVTDKGKAAMLRVVTYGQTTTNSVDTSPEAYQLLNTGEYPRNMTWQFARCPDTGPMMYEFQTGSSQFWTSLWVRNARVPLTTVEVQSVNHASWTALARGTDGTLTDATGFGVGTFSIRSTGIDASRIVDTFSWPSTGIAGAFLTGKANFL